ncbi:MAG: SpoIIE family protein phosphatase, partial [Bacteroidales bacterium]|nr:SpoIIE family protein phosphatase [Bacteroidales bacterium]
HYASLIQHAAMPSEAELRRLFADTYIIYRPLHIVAGDFYWVNQAGKYKMAACADSTGHGVPGAFVSMLGISLLNDLAPSVLQNNGSAALILNEMRRRLMYALGQDKHKYYDIGTQSNMDGIDIALAVIDTETNTLQYAGAYRPLWIYSNGTITEFKPDRMPIGIHAGDLKDFKGQTMPIHQGDILYMFTDGIPDQFGYTDENKTEYKNFSAKKLRTLVTSIATLPFPQQQSTISSAIDTWQNGYQQLDDITFFAVKL